MALRQRLCLVVLLTAVYALLVFSNAKSDGPKRKIHRRSKNPTGKIDLTDVHDASHATKEVVGVEEPLHSMTLRSSSDKMEYEKRLPASSLSSSIARSSSNVYEQLEADRDDSYMTLALHFSKYSTFYSQVLEGFVDSQVVPKWSDKSKDGYVCLAEKQSAVELGMDDLQAPLKEGVTLLQKLRHSVLGVIKYFPVSIKKADVKPALASSLSHSRNSHASHRPTASAHGEAHELSIKFSSLYLMLLSGIFCFRIVASVYVHFDDNPVDHSIIEIINALIVCVQELFQEPIESVVLALGLVTVGQSFRFYPGSMHLKSVGVKAPHHWTANFVVFSTADTRHQQRLFFPIGMLVSFILLFSDGLVALYVNYQGLIFRLMSSSLWSTSSDSVKSILLTILPFFALRPILKISSFCFLLIYCFRFFKPTLTVASFIMLSFCVSIIVAQLRLLR